MGLEPREQRHSAQHHEQQQTDSREAIGPVVFVGDGECAVVPQHRADCHHRENELSPQGLQPELHGDDKDGDEQQRDRELQRELQVAPVVELVLQHTAADPAGGNEGHDGQDADGDMGDDVLDSVVHDELLPRLWPGTNQQILPAELPRPVRRQHASIRLLTI